MGRMAEMAYEQDQQQQEQEMFQAELYIKTIEALKKCVNVLTADELAVLTYQCGIKPKELL
jgi:hypothetical protein